MKKNQKTVLDNYEQFDRLTERDMEMLKIKKIKSIYFIMDDDHILDSFILPKEMVSSFTFCNVIRDMICIEGKINEIYHCDCMVFNIDVKYDKKVIDDIKKNIVKNVTLRYEDGTMDSFINPLYEDITYNSANLKKDKLLKFRSLGDDFTEVVFKKRNVDLSKLFLNYQE